MEKIDFHDKIKILENHKEVSLEIKGDDQEKKKNLILEIASYLQGIGAVFNDDYRKEGIDIALKKIDSFNLDYNNLNLIIIKRGILVCEYSDNNKTFHNLIFDKTQGDQKINELKGVDNNNNNLREQNNKETIQDIKKFTENIDKESLFGGTMILSYSAIVGTSNFFIDKILVKKQNGKIETISLEKGGINSGKKADLKLETFKLLESKGIFYDAKTNSFEKIKELNLTSSIVSELKGITYKQYIEELKAEGKEIISEKDFLKKQKQLIKEVEKLNITERNIKKVQGFFGKYGFGGGIQHIIFLPVFFQTYHKQTSDLASLGKSLSEWGLFTIGAKAGAKLPGNAITKGIAGLVGGIGFIIGGEHIGEKLNLDKHFWKQFPEREDFWEKKGWKGKSFLTHALTLGTVNDLVDDLGFDIKIPFTPIVFVQTDVNIDTNPYEYMSSGVRNINNWNNKVDEYRTELVNKLYSKIKSISIQNKIIEEKKQNGFITTLIEKEITEFKNMKIDDCDLIYGLGEYEGFDDIKIELFESMKFLALNTDYNINKKMVSEIIGNIINKIKIDNSFISKKENLLLKKRFNFEAILGKIDNNDGNRLVTFIKDNSSIKDLNRIELNYVSKIYDRLLSHEKIIKNNLEKNMFEKLLENQNFVHFLNDMVEYKRDKDYIKNLIHFGTPVKWENI